MAKQIFANYNATTPLDSDAKKALCEAADVAWGNPSSSSHAAGAEAKRIIERARQQVAEMIEARPEEIIFTSGGTESNNMVIQTALRYFAANQKSLQNGEVHVDEKPKAHLVVSELEHDSIFEAAKQAEREGVANVTSLMPDERTGAVNVNQLLAALRRETVLVCVILAQNETGVMQPVAEIGSQLAKVNTMRRERGWPPVMLHTDAAQAIGKVPVSVRTLSVDYLTIVGHKFYGPRIGALYVRGLGFKAVNAEAEAYLCNGNAPAPAPIYPLLFGGGQERALRSGTENTPCIAALGCAAQLVSRNLSAYHGHMLSVTSHFESRLRTEFADLAVFNSHFPDFFVRRSSETIGDMTENCECDCNRHLPNTVNVAILPPADCADCEKYRAVNLLKTLSHTFHAGAGSACHGGRPSRVLLACFGNRHGDDHIEQQIPPRVANAIRFSFGRETTLDEVDAIVDALKTYFAS